jgi:heme-degrading monooxygenase HmoA
MAESRVHLAQVNIGRIRAPLDSPQLAGFVGRLEEINALADRSPGFVWRLQTDEGNATYLRPYDDERILVNMSVWESLEHLKAYVYSSNHRELLKQRREWFEAFSGAYLALWWVPEGHRPSVDEAKQRLAHLEANGPTPFAFTFKVNFPADEDFIKATDWSKFVPFPLACGEPRHPAHAAARTGVRALAN